MLLTKRRRAALVALASAAATVAVGWVLMPRPSHQYFFHLVFDDRRIGAPGFVADQSLNGLWTRVAHGYVAGTCQREGECASRGLWMRLKQSIDLVLSQTTLAEMVADQSLIDALAPSGPEVGL